jgi:hypothetical protein
MSIIFSVAQHWIPMSAAVSRELERRERGHAAEVVTERGGMTTPSPVKLFAS